MRAYYHAMGTMGTAGAGSRSDLLLILAPPLLGELGQGSGADVLNVVERRTFGRLTPDR